MRIPRSTRIASHRISAKAADLQQVYYRWESNLKELQEGRPTGLHDDVKANAMRHMMPKEILDAVKPTAAISHFC